MKMHLDRVFQTLMGLTALLTVLLVACIVKVLSLNQESSAITARRFQSYLLADELRQSSDDLTRLARTYVVSGDAKWEQQYFEVLDIRNGKKPRPAHYERIYWDFRAADQTPSGIESATALSELMRQAGFTDQEFAKLEQAKKNSDDLVRTETIAMNMVKGLYDDGRGGFTKKAEPDRDKASAMMHDLAYHQYKARIMEPVNEFLIMLDGRTAGEVAHVEARLQRWVVAAIVVAVIQGVLLISTILWAHRGIRSALNRVREAAQAVASGDLSQRDEMAWSNDVIGQLMQAVQEMRQRLARTISGIRDTAQSIAHGSTEIAAGNTSLSQRTEEQAASLQQTAATMEQMNATVRNSADAARQAAQMAGQAREAAERGGQRVGEVVSTMGEIAARSNRIADIIGVIDGIAFQTNILALNAAVEAARAGEQGRGFAVVASEVRSLAQRSAEAAKEIKQLIHSSVEKVEAGTRLVGETGSGMDDLVRQVRQVAQLIGDISTATGEQSDGIGQVNQAVSQLESVTQQNAALVEQSAAASDSLQRQAGALRDAVSAFRLQGA